MREVVQELWINKESWNQRTALESLRPNLPKPLHN